MKWFQGLRKTRRPVRLLAAPADPVIGDIDRARALLKGEIRSGSERFQLAGADWSMRSASEAFRTHVHGFLWLRDFAAAVPQDKAADFLLPILTGWLSAHEEPEGPAWRPDRAGARIVMWSVHAPYVMGSNAQLRTAALAHMVQAAQHLDTAAKTVPPGLPTLQAAVGAVAASLLIDGRERGLKRAEKRLSDAIDQLVMANGLPTSRAPADLLDILEWLHLARTAYQARGADWPEAQRAADGRVRAGLRAARLGDGSLTAVHGGNIGRSTRIEHALGWPGSADRSIRPGVDSGLQRMEAGRTILLLDAGPPPEPTLNPMGHAGALAFEMSDEHERIVVNVGGGRGARGGIDRRLATAVRTTAAHSTLVLADHNQSAVLEGEPIGAGVAEVGVERDDESADIRVSASHDGYRRRYGLVHQRDLVLTEDGRLLTGEDRLVQERRKRGRAPLPLALRFHLHPGVDVTPTADARGAVLRLHSGALWQFKAEFGTLSVDESLWIGEEGAARRTRQLVIADDLVPGSDPDGWSGRWTFRKMG